MWVRRIIPNKGKLQNQPPGGILVPTGDTKRTNSVWVATTMEGFIHTKGFEWLLSARLFFFLRVLVTILSNAWSLFFPLP